MTNEEAKLSRYEDTGLEPEEIKVILERYRAFRSAVSDETGQPMVSWTRAREICKADKDGRLVVLPVPIGKDKLAYALPDSFSCKQEIFTIECERLDGLEIWDNPSGEIVVVVDGCEIGQSDIGKTVFLTRAEAEAALKKREED